jgi:hypothetical protein
VAVLTLTMAGSAVAAQGGNGGASLAQIRAATAKFHDLGAALAAGYIPASGCEALPGVGGMGVHYLKPQLAADLAIDPLTPEVLLYAPSADGWRLVGVEYFEVALAITESGPAPWFGDDAPPLGFLNPAPEVLGNTFEGPMHGHSPSMPWHYDKHVWVWQPNSNGMFAQWNPAVSCD